MRASASYNLSLLMSAWALAACGGGEPTPSTEHAQVQAARPGELVEFVRKKLLQRQASGAPIESFGGVLAAAAAAGGDIASRAASNPLLQEAGVDEDNLIKADAALQHLYTLHPGVAAGESARLGTLRVWHRDATGSAVEQSVLGLDTPAGQGGIAQGLYHADASKRVVVLSKSWASTPLPGCQPPCELSLMPPVRIDNKIDVQVVDVANPAAPTLAQRINFDGLLLDSRVIGQTLYVVSVHAPRLAFEALPPTATDAQRAAALAALSAGDILPAARVNGAAMQPLLADTDCYLEPGNASSALEITTITAFDLGSPSVAGASRCFVGGSEALSMSPTHLTLATTRYAYDAGAARLSYPPQITTDVHRFALDGKGIRWSASGSVPGHLGWDAQRKSTRLSEFGGDLRVLSFTGESGWATAADATNAGAPPPSPATLTVLRQNGTTLERLATLPNAQRPAPIGKPGEQVYGVRFVGTRAFVVTFRQIDPLYLLDLSNPTDPRISGELTMLGFSSDLYLLANDLLLGIGRDADANGRIGGVKVALIDLADPTQPRLAASRVYGSTGSQSGLDHARQGASLVVQGNQARLALPLTLVGANFTFVDQGVQRIDVDAQARTLLDKPFLSGASSGAAMEPWNDRVLQTGSKLHYLTQGGVASLDW